MGAGARLLFTKFYVLAFASNYSLIITGPVVISSYAIMFFVLLGISYFYTRQVKQYFTLFLLLKNIMIGTQIL
jgi:hypothetical protein